MKCEAGEKGPSDSILERTPYHNTLQYTFPDEQNEGNLAPAENVPLKKRRSISIGGGNFHIVNHCLRKYE